MQDVGGTIMAIRGAIEVEVSPVGLFRLLEVAALLVYHPREDPNTGFDLALPAQPVDPLQDFILVTEHEMSISNTGPSLRVPLSLENLGAFLDRCFVLLLVVQIETALDSAPLASGQNASESQSPRPGGLSRHR